MASNDENFKQQNGFTEEDLEKYKQSLREHNLVLYYAARTNGLPRNNMEEKMEEYLKRKEQEQNWAKNKKWMIISPLHTTAECAVEAQFDTGADANFITEGMVQDRGLKKSRLSLAQKVNTAVGEFVCDYEVMVNWRGRDRAYGRIHFFVLPDGARIDKPLIGNDWAETYWEMLLDEPPKDTVYYTALKKEKAKERIDGAELRAVVQGDQSRLRHNKETYEQKQGSQAQGSSSGQEATQRKQAKR
ncbi:hypothetical protein JX265_001667 [Neoarthrinium moseri]|uniref:Uncharacterized protein n=1 Tax=Neoarthrinium moseri TaxID=1658444 RepID=A0A9P9WVZ1_9PEZI|nr:uncharacterized protein JN550_005240 [Neoarthrinium moseri]KAI1842954.1 hypothetical protein JX266_010807 [Neoarthrinium moseri]KAI1870312.1 hypothetical protein JN550_005240 [Neoarthrinium moseri]KAI1880046.1 hypothetical protein JX265_001667 [Neoarthrinium moseri]